MSYIGKAPGFGIRNRYYYTATASQTTFSGADDNGQTLAYADSKYLDVYLNGVLLVAGTDYTATTLTSVTLTSGAAASDIVEIVAYDIFSVADTVSASNGGTFNGNITIDGDLSVDGGTIKLDGNYPVGTNNVALGDGALDDGSLTGGSNTAIGTDALTANTTGADNVAVGFQALDANTTGGRNVAVGNNALSTYNVTDSGLDYNVAVGYNASTALTTANETVSVGAFALSTNTTGGQNTAVGYGSLALNTTASNNTAVGKSALGANDTGTQNTAVGASAGDAITTGSYNCFVGQLAGTNATTGNANNLFGWNAGGLITTGAKNTVVGSYDGNQGGLDIRTSSNYIVLSDGDGNPRAWHDGTSWNGIGGKVLQVVAANDILTATNTNSTSFVATTLAATITPTSASSKILVTATFSATQDGGSTEQSFVQIYRGASNLRPSGTPLFMYDHAGGNVGFSGTYMFYDSPATTSATTYTVYVKVSGSSSFFRAVAGTDTITLLEIA